MKEKQLGKRGKGVIKSGVAVALVLLMAFSLVACGLPQLNSGQTDEATVGESTTDGTTTTTDKETDPLSSIAKLLQAEGRPYNNVTTGQLGDTLTNTFFEWTVSNVVAQDTLLLDGEEIVPNAAGYKFVLIDITTKNIFEQPNPMGNVDFSIIWGDGDDTTEDVAFSEFMDGMYPDKFEQAVGDSASGVLVFEVPQDVHSAIVAYYELWDDEFEGDTYLFELTF
jgi:hypothetical protein